MTDHNPQIIPENPKNQAGAMNDPVPEAITREDLAGKFDQLRPRSGGPDVSAPTAAEIQRSRQIQKGDFVNKLGELQGGVQAKTVEAKTQIVQVAAIAGAAVVAIGFLLGLRRGKSKSTVVEIRRV